jgi:hypothetical protein
LFPDRRVELIEIMDDYGTSSHLYVPVTQLAQRGSLVTDAISEADQAQAQLEAYASSAGHSLTAMKEAGIAKRKAYASANGITLS